MFYRVFNGGIVFRIFDLVKLLLSISKIDKIFWPTPQINMHDIELLSVKFDKFLNVVFSLLKWNNLAQNGWFSGKNNFRTTKFPLFDHVTTIWSFFSRKFRLVITIGDFLNLLFTGNTI